MSGKTETEVFGTEYLLAVDAGVVTGLALFDRTGKLQWYRSHNMGSVSALRRAAYKLLNDTAGLSVVVVEGGGPVAEAWIKTAERLYLSILKTDAGQWRKTLLLPRERRNSEIAKQCAIHLAQQIIRESGVASYNSPTHDAAEAILIGTWGTFIKGWISKLPQLQH